MKRTVLLIVALALALTAGAVSAGCADDTPDETTTTAAVVTTATTQAPGTTTGTSATGTSAPGTAGDAKATYDDLCALCHGLRGEGAQGPALGDIDDADDVREQIEQGEGDHPEFGSQLSETEMNALIEYVLDLETEGSS